MQPWSETLQERLAETQSNLDEHFIAQRFPIQQKDKSRCIFQDLRLAFRSHQKCGFFLSCFSCQHRKVKEV